MCQFVVVLTKMEDNGIYIDRKALDEVEQDFQEEYDKLRVDIDEIIYTRMGDTKVNPASPEPKITSFSFIYITYNFFIILILRILLL